MHATNTGERPGIRSILAVVDLSQQGGWAVKRATQLAAAHGATLKIVSTGRAAGTLKHLVDEARAVDLVVMGDVHENALVAFIGGSVAERIARVCRCPILVVRRAPTRQYAQILVAVDFTPDSKQLVRLACDLDADAEIQLFHAISTRNEAKLRSAEASAHQVRTYRRECLKYARNRILWFTDSFDARRNRVMSTVGHGDPARQAVIQQEFIRADLLVVGRRQRSLIADFFLGSVSERVLRWAKSDVLIAPRILQTKASIATARRTEGESNLRPVQAR